MLHTTHRLDNTIPGIEVTETFGDFANDFAETVPMEYTPPEDAPVDLVETTVGIATKRLDSFLDQLQRLNYRYAYSGIRYTSSADYRAELADIKLKCVKDMLGV